MKKSVLTLTMVMLAAGIVLADVPPVLNHQGMLTDDLGQPLTGVHYMIFRLYEVAEGGAEIWSEAQAVTVENGIFNVYLGVVSPLDDTLFEGQDIWLGVTVEDDGEMTPRLRMGSVLYAFTANRDASTPPTWYLDGDGDNYGDPSISTVAFIQPSGYIGNSLDCDDGDPDVNPAAAEIDCDGIDHDCDGHDANGVTGPLCAQQVGVCAGATMTCSGGLWVTCTGGDFGPDYEPDEQTCDGLDNDCDGFVDEGAYCDDGDPCTIDTCMGASGCQHTPMNCDDGLACTDDSCVGGVCVHTPIPNYCYIDGVCYSDGATVPGYDCQYCDAENDPFGWTFRPPSWECNPGPPATYCTGVSGDCPTVPSPWQGDGR